MARKHTTEHIAKLIENETTGDYILVSEYTGAHTKVDIKHSICGNVQHVRLGHFLDGRRCKQCNSPRKSNEEFLSEVALLVGEEYEFLEAYIDSQTNIKVLHTVCGHSYTVRPGNFLQGKRCPKCANNIRFTTKEFKQQVNELVGDEYTVVGEYVNTLTKIELLHTKCGNRINIEPGSFKLGNRCSFCHGGVKIHTTETYRQYVYDSTNGEYEVNGEYINASTYMEFTHNICRNSYRSYPDWFNSGRRCRFCSGHMKKSTESFIEEVSRLVNDEYSVLGEYVNNMTKITMMHNLCSHIYEVSPAHFLGTKNRAGSRCPACFKNEKRSTTIFREELLSFLGGDYEVIGEYTGANKKIEILHKKCGDIFTPTPSNLLRGKSGCLCESENRGESKVKELLDLHSVNFRKQYSHPDCKFRAPLRFDFALYNDLNQLQCLIEYDGKQHHEPIEYFGGEKAFKLQQKKDKIKDDYCKANNIPLIRIPYWDFKNIDSILTERLTELGVLSPALVEV